MRVLLTGGTGFIGGSVARQLRERGDDVVAFVRSATRATALEGLGCSIVEGSVTDSFAVERAVEGVDSVIHLAGRYQVGINKQECPSMQDINIGGVRHVLDASIQAGVQRIVYASTVNVFGDTRGKLVNESYRRNPLEGFLSCYDESKYRAHLLAEDRISKGAPVVMVQPCSVYGPHDHSTIGNQIFMAARGDLQMRALIDVGLTMAHVDDIARGFLLALDNGQIGQSYILGGETLRLRDALEKAAALNNRRLSGIQVPTGLLKLIAPLAPSIAPKFGYPPNFKELIKAGDGVTYWATDEKARNELGYSTRELDTGLTDTFKAMGIKPAQ